jgi:tRNA (guanine10-N2)-dimethyltransferase
MLLIFTTKDHKKIAKAEIDAIIKDYKKTDESHIFISKKKYSKEFERLAYISHIDEIIFISEINKIEKTINNFDWNKIINDSYLIDVHGKINSKKKEFANLIYDKVNNPKIDFKNPKDEIHFYIINDKIYCTLLKHKQKEDFESRKPHKRPEIHPSSLHPRLARAIVNLTKIKKGEVVDPCCGSGGILIEAGLMGFKIKGYDLDKIMVERSKINIKSYNLSGDIKVKDCLTIKDEIDYIVVDLPYAKNTSVKNDIEIFYNDFCLMLSKVLKKRAVICFPDFVDYKKYIDNANLKEIKLLKYRLHKSLSKLIVVVEKV